MIDLSDVGYVLRIPVGRDNPATPKGEEEKMKAMALLNRCLTEVPKGRIIAIEKDFGIFQIGEHNVVLQPIAYHVGFTRRPYWIKD
jgi:hypothetical protein